MKKITLMLFMMFLSVCAFAQLPQETFETWPVSTGNWIIQQQGPGTQTWAQGAPDGPFAGVSNTNAAYVQPQNSSTIPNPNVDWLISKPFTVPANPQLYFLSRWLQGGDQGARVDVMISTNADPTVLSSYVSLIDSDGWSEAEINPQQTAWTEKTLAIPASYIGQQAHIAFVYKSANNADRWIIDNVSVETKCQQPGPITISAHTSVGFTVAFTPITGVTNYELEIVEEGQPQTGIATHSFSTVPPYTLTNLLPGKIYRVYARTMCSPTNPSDWAGPQAAFTYPLGSTCGSPIEIAGGSYQTTDNTANYPDLVNGTAGTGCNGIATSLNGNDVIYRYTASFTGPISISLSNNGAATGLFVYDECAGIGTACLAGDTGNASSPPDIPTFDVITGEDYYIVISTSGSTPSTAYTLTIQPVSCTPPVGQPTQGIGPTSAQLFWSNPTAATTWHVVVQAQGTGLPGTTTPYQTATTNAGFDPGALNQATAYEYWVRSDCNNGTFSAWAGPYFFMTTQIPEILNYTQDFENDGTGWSLINGNQVNKWYIGSAVNNGGLRSLYVSNNNGLNNQYTITTASAVHAYRDIEIPAGVNEINISFDWRANGQTGNTDYMRVWSVPITYNPVAGTAITTGAGRLPVSPVLQESNDWTNVNYTMNVTAYDGEVRRFIVEWRNNATTGAQAPAAIDNFNINIVSCSTPSALAVPAATITQSQATVNWTAAPFGTPSYDYYISTSDVPPTAITAASGTAGTATTVTIPALESSTTYYVWVRSNCGPADGNSFWIGPVAFLTPQIPAILTYTDDFEGPIKWTLSNGAQPNKWVVGSAVNNGGAKSMYVSNDNGNTNTYANQTSIVHAYRDFTITAGLEEIEIMFDWRAIGEGTNFDLLKVWMVPTSFNPTPGTRIAAGANRVLIAPILNQNGNFTTASYTQQVGAIDGENRRIVFEWINDAIQVNNPPAAIDNVNLVAVTCRKPQNLTVTTATITQTTAELNWAEMNTATNWQIVVLPEGSPMPALSFTGNLVTGAPTYVAGSVTPLMPGTTYVFYVRSDCGAADGLSTWAGPFLFTTKISNDECDTAITVPVNPGTQCLQTVGGTVTGATASPQANTCPGNDNDDVWFTFTSTQTTHEISLIDVVGGTTLNFGVFAGTCGALTQVDCSNTPTRLISTLTPNTQYFIRIYSASATATGTRFKVCIKSPPPPIKVSTTQYTVQQLIEDIFIDSDCAIVSNFTSSTGSTISASEPNGIGYFEQNGSEFPMSAGIVLVTDDAMKAPGPNEFSGSWQVQSFNQTTWTGDTDLQNILGITNTWNRTFIAFDFLPLMNRVSFDFLFASEEYDQGFFECDYDDAFAFILTDLTTGVKTNLAVLPGGAGPVSVTNIHPDNGLCGGINEQHFGQYNTTPYDAIHFNGQTKLLTASGDVIPNHQYNIKLVIANHRDANYDSAIFLLENSFSSGAVELGVDLLVDTDNAVCAGNEVTIESGLNPDNFDFAWKKGSDVIPNENGPDLTVTEPGEYTIMVTPTGWACAEEDTVIVEFYTPISSITTPPVNLTNCNASGYAEFDLTEQTATILGTLAPANFIISYHLSQEDADLEQGAVALNYTNVVQFEQTLYARIYEVSTQCTFVVPFKLVVQDLTPLFAIEEDFAICDGGTETITVVPTAGNFDVTSPDVTFVWSDQNGPLPDTTPSITVSQAGVYTVVVTNTGCPATDSVTVTVTPVPVADDLTDVTECGSYTLLPLTSGNYYTATGGPLGGGTMLNAGTVIETTQTIYVFAEATGTTTPCTDETDFIVTILNAPDVNNPDDQTACVTYTLPAITTGSYYTATGGPAGGGTLLNAGDLITTSQTIHIYAETGGLPNCVTNESFDVTILALPDAVAPASVTECDSYELPALAVGAYYTGQNGTGTQLNAGDDITTTQTIYVFASSGANCSDEDSFIVTIVPSPLAITISEGCQGSEYVLAVVFNPGETNYNPGNVAYAWSRTEGGTVIATTPTYVAEDQGEYYVTVTATGPGGCYVTESINVTSNACMIQRGISPNGDGKNDSFDLTALSVNKLSIFNRYGTKVYSYSQYTNQWYGQQDGGGELPTGTYFYSIERANGEDMSGWVYINREE